ncbi:excinuclease ABC subunit UvrA [Microbacterium sp. CBS5P-1]|nr:excinuclease ABC subunit UvrA [Microbacterium excoecariae]
MRVRGAREHNLRNVDLDVPRNRIVAFTGVSGSGKSSLAFATIYAEAQRRFFASVAPYARRLIQQVGAPDVDEVSGLPPAVALEQQRGSGGSRSTVGTVTTISDVVRMLFSRVGDYPDGADPLLAENFSPHTVEGACPACHGIGRVHDATEERMVPDASLSIREGAIAAWPRAWHGTQLRDSLVSLGYDVDRPWRDLPADAREWILFTDETPRVPVYAKRAPAEARRAREAGEKPSYMSRFVGARRLLLDTLSSSQSRAMRERAATFLDTVDCCACGGRRLRPEALAVRVEGLDVTAFGALPLDEVAQIADRIRADAWRPELAPERRLAAKSLATELAQRLEPVLALGLGYLGLDRETPTLSAGELQRMRLATQVLSKLFGVVFVLDEPSAGLHPSDAEALGAILTGLRDAGNSVLIVEHAPRVIQRADWIVDMGPAAGAEGGEVVYSGPVAGIRDAAASATAPYLDPDPRARPDAPGRRPIDQTLRLEGVTRHNLAGLDVEVPLGALVAVTGVSGSGKTTLASDALPALAGRAIGADASDPTPSGDDDTGADEGGLSLEPRAPETRGAAHAPPGAFSRIVRVDQRPIGRTSRSNVATYTGAFDRIRALFARTPVARERRFGASRFSFNTPAGRCPTCRGEGSVEVELLFLPTVSAPCSACGGARYNPETLAVTRDGRSIADVLALRVHEARAAFADDAIVTRHLDALIEVGLGYLALGQAAPTLSGGEAQRVKLAAELQRAERGDTLYVLDEPTSGLHPADADRLVGHLQSLVNAGNSVVVVEHNMRVVAEADWVIELGPGAGEGGGSVVAAGTPEHVAERDDVPSARYLRAALRGEVA